MVVGGTVASGGIVMYEGTATLFARACCATDTDRNATAQTRPAVDKVRFGSRVAYTKDINQLVTGQVIHR